MELQFAGGSYESAVVPFSAQRAVNVFTEVAEAGARAPAMLRRRPGLAAFATGGGYDSRGAVVMGGVLYVVWGRDLFSVTSLGVVTRLGTVGGTGPVGIVADTSSVAIVNGTTSSIVYDGSFQTVTLPFAADTVDYDGGYFIYHETDSRRYFVSALNDPTTHDALDVSTRSDTADNLTRAFPSNGDLVLFGHRRTQLYRNVGDVDFPYTAQEGTERDQGTASPHSIVGLGTVRVPYFLGTDRVVYRINGAQIERVSNFGIEQRLAQKSVDEIESAIGQTYTYEGHHFYVLHVGSDTLVFDATAAAALGQMVWSEYTTEDGPFVGRHFVEAWGETYCTTDDGRVLRVSREAYTDAGSNIWCKRTLAPFVSETQNVFLSRMEAICLTGQDSDAQLKLRVSRDGGQTWGADSFRALGASGRYDARAIWRRLGMSNMGRVFEFSFTADADVAFLVLSIQAEAA